MVKSGFKNLRLLELGVRRIILRRKCVKATACVLESTAYLLGKSYLSFSTFGKDLKECSWQ